MHERKPMSPFTAADAVALETQARKRGGGEGERLQASKM